MAIITLSRGTRSGGREIAEEVAHRLGYACISWDILLDASEIFNAPQLKLHQAIHDAPSLLDRFTNGKERYIAFVRATLLRFFTKRQYRLSWVGRALFREGHRTLSQSKFMVSKKFVCNIT